MSEAPAARTPPQVEDFPETGPNSLASVVERVVSTILDGLVFAVPAALGVVAAVQLGDVDATSRSLQAWVVFGTALAWAAYQVGMVRLWGRTLGSWAMGYRVARWSDGETPDLSQASVRALLPASFAVLPVPILNAGWVLVFMGAAYDPLRRGFHDRAAGTVVVRTR